MSLCHHEFQISPRHITIWHESNPIPIDNTDENPISWTTTGLSVAKEQAETATKPNLLGTV
jgi:hypothetical protein